MIKLPRYVVIDFVDSAGAHAQLTCFMLISYVSVGVYSLLQVWDYQTKSCVQTLEGHSHNVSAVCFHPELPIILTGSEDGTVRIWHATTYR